MRKKKPEILRDENIMDNHTLNRKKSMRAPSQRFQRLHRFKSGLMLRISIHAVGILSLLWLIFRSGFKPTRLYYPCQRAALACVTSSLTHWATFLGTSYAYLAFRRGIRIWASSSRTKGSHILRIACFTTASASFLVYAAILAMEQTHEKQALAETTLELPSWTNPTAISDVFVVKNVPPPVYSIDEGVIPPGVSPNEALRETGIEVLCDLMASRGLFLYKTSDHPDGIIGANDIVIIKINKQWHGREDDRYNHTNIDRLKGLIYKIVSHPEGFSGLVIIAENTQGRNPSFDAIDYNNAEDPLTSYQDVIDAFVSQGHPVTICDWGAFRGTFVSEFSEGDSTGGYVLEDDLEGPGADELSWPKFTISVGTQTYAISMRYGLWDGSTYDNTIIKYINMPVIKAHGMAGATLAIKNYIGFLTIFEHDRRFGSWDEMHGYFWGYTGSHTDYGLLGRQVARVRKANLDILDGTWINPARNFRYSEACVREDILLASTDPVALDYYASAYCLAPIGNPDRSSAAVKGAQFRNFLLANENRMWAEGVTDIIDLDDSYTQEQEEAQFNVYVADASAPTPTPTPAPFLWGDLNADGVPGSLDAGLLLQYDALLIDGFPGYPDITRPDFPAAADLNADGVPGSLDAGLLLQYDALLIPAFPADTNQDGYGPDG